MAIFKDQPEITFSYDAATDIVTICGTRFTGDFFRTQSPWGVGHIIEIVEQDDGVLTIRRFPGLEEFIRGERDAARDRDA